MFLKQNFESLLKAHWTEFIDVNQMIKLVLEQVKKLDCKVVKQKIPGSLWKPALRITATKFEIVENYLEVWIEYAVPKDGGAVIGTLVFILRLDGTIQLKEGYGTCFQAESVS